jgi:hypothetical protein
MRVSSAANGNSGAPAVRIRFSLRQLFVWIFCISVVLAVVVALAGALQSARRAAIASAAQGPLNQLQLALQCYHDTHGRFPPAFITDEDGVPMHSWRVLILPYVEKQALYDAYDFAEPWDGPNNSMLANHMPQVFHSPSEPKSTAFTNIVAITGPGTAFPGNTSTTLADFVDGPENTILLTEIANSKVPWLRPRDIDIRSTFDAHAPETLRISAARWRSPYVVFADRIKAYCVRRNTPPEAFKALTTIAGGERCTRSQLVDQGYLD